LFLTEAAFSTIRQAMGYVRDQNDVGDGDGDVSDQWAKANDSVLAAIGKAPTRDIHADMQALADVFGMAVTSACNCEGERGTRAGKRTHASDCPITTHRHALDRVEALRQLFHEAMHK
jgi:hypothetical protein